MKLNKAQLNKLSDVSFDIAKAMFIAGFSIPIIKSAFDPAALIQFFSVGFLYAILGLQLIKKHPNYDRSNQLDP